MVSNLELFWFTDYKLFMQHQAFKALFMTGWDLANFS
jgi:hypothetical protein